MKHIIILFCLIGLSAKGQTVLVGGTSIDYGLGATSPDSGWVPRVKLELGWSVINKAFPNATYLDTTNYTIISQLRSQKSHHFDIVILGGPTNDAQPKYKGGNRVRNAYKRVVDSVKLWWPEATIIYMTPIPSRSPFIPQITLDTLITPMVVAQGGLICNFAQLPSIILSPDRIHPDNWGYARMAQSFVAWYRGKREPVIKERDPIEAPIVELRVGNRMVRKRVMQVP